MAVSDCRSSAGAIASARLERADKRASRPPPDAAKAAARRAEAAAKAKAEHEEQMRQWEDEMRAEALTEISNILPQLQSEAASSAAGPAVVDVVNATPTIHTEVKPTTSTEDAVGQGGLTDGVAAANNDAAVDADTWALTDADTQAAARVLVDAEAQAPAVVEAQAPVDAEAQGADPDDEIAEAQGADPDDEIAAVKAAFDKARAEAAAARTEAPGHAPEARPDIDEPAVQLQLVVLARGEGCFVEVRLGDVSDLA